MPVTPLHRQNNFDFIRFFAAFAVIYGHSQTLSGLPDTAIFSASCSTFGLLIFFCLSGYLVTDSWEAQPNAILFFSKRCLRIFPALIVVTILSACVLGPSMTTVSWSEYFWNSNFYGYFGNIVLYIHYNLPGIFEGNHYKYAVNGSLWSLPAEFFCYILVAAIGICLRGFRGYGLLAVAVAAGLITLYHPYYHGPQIVIYATDAFSTASVVPYFFVGAAIRVFRIPLRTDVALLMLFGLVISTGNIIPELSEPLTWTVLPYVTIAFGQAATPIISRWGRFGDFSYGLYLYSFPVSQIILSLYPKRLEIHAFVLVVTLICLIFSAASWHIVERHALRLKPKRSMTFRGIMAARPILISGLGQKPGDGSDVAGTKL